MKRVLFVVLGLMAAMTAIGLIFAFTRPIRWPANVRPLAWRRAVGDAIEQRLEEEVAA